MRLSQHESKSLWALTGSRFFLVSLALHAVAFCGVNATAGDCASLVYRTYDGECASFGNAVWGRAHEAQYSYDAKLDARRPRMNRFPSARLVSNLLCAPTNSYEARRWKRREVTEFSTFFGQFLDHDLSATLDDPLKRLDIPVPADEITFADKESLPFMRSVKAPVPYHQGYSSVKSRSPTHWWTSRRSLRRKRSASNCKWKGNRDCRRRKCRKRCRCARMRKQPWRRRSRCKCSCKRKQRNNRPKPSMLLRPSNNVSAVLDLSQIYGSDSARAALLRTNSSGRLRHSTKGDVLTLNTAGVRNAPLPTASFFLSGDHRVNEHGVLTALHIVWSREHNRIADEILAVFPKWSDEQVFQTARSINIAQAQRIVYEEYYPALTGLPPPPSLPPSSTFLNTTINAQVNPAPSVEFTTAAFRIGHSMVSGVLRLQPTRQSPMVNTSLLDGFFRNASSFMNKGGVDAFLRPLWNVPASHADTHVTPALRNSLFRSVRGQIALDLAAQNIQRGRDHRLPLYNDMRALLGLPRKRNFAQLSSDPGVRSTLRKLYGSINRVELWVGLLAERPAFRGALGRTTVEIWRRDFSRLAWGDRSHYRYGNAGIPNHVVTRVQSARDAVLGKTSMRDILLRNTGLHDDEIPQDLWQS